MPSEPPGDLAPVVPAGSDDSTCSSRVDYASAALEAVSEGVVVQLAHGEIISCNPAAERILGLTLDQMRGRTSLDLNWEAIHDDGSPFPGETHPSILTLRTGEALRGVVMGVHSPDGTLRWISINSEPIPGRDGRPAAVVTTFVDITDRKRAEGALQNAEEHFRTMFLETPIGVALIDSDTGHIYEVNPRFAEIADRTRTELATIDWMSITHPDDVGKDQDQLDLLNAGKISRCNMEKRFSRPDGSYFWIKMTIAPISIDDRARRRYLFMIEDISYRKRVEAELSGYRDHLEDLVAEGTDSVLKTNADLQEMISFNLRSEKALRESETDFRLMVESVKDYSIIMLDPNGLVMRWNAGAELIKGYRSEEIVGQHFSRFYLQEDIEQGKPEQALAVATTEGRFEAKAWRVRKDGSRFLSDVIMTSVRDESGVLRGFGEITRDITERKRNEDQILVQKAELKSAVKEVEKMHDLAYFDSLTGLGNRRYAEEKIRSSLAESHRYGWSLGLLFVDIDKFKGVNDVYGHDVGDAVLQMVGSTLRNAARSSDFVARWGGEEFVVLAPRTGPGELRDVAERLRISISTAETTVPLGRFSVTVSIGGTVVCSEDSLELLVARADERMYAAKKAGRNCVVTVS